MKSMTIKDALSGNPYCGRGIIIGSTEEGGCVCAYYIMGRSENSRNRVFVKENENLMIKPFDESKVEDPSLIIYYPVRKYDKGIIITNGDQTDTVYDYISAKKTFEEALFTRMYEPDRPNYTPRISGIVEYGDFHFEYKLSILKRENSEFEACSRHFYNYSSIPAHGHLIHTYVTDGNPLPSFEGEPKKITIDSDIDDFTDAIWESLNKENRISLYVRYSDCNGKNVKERIINKFGGRI